MANHYQQSSSFLNLNKEQLEKANDIIEKACSEYEEINDMAGVFNYNIEDDGVWFYGDEYIDIEALEYTVRYLVEELEVESPFFASWAYTCSKPRVDEFGGGAMVVAKGKETIWVDSVAKAFQEYMDIKKRT